MSDRDRDPNLVRNQPSLKTSSGAIWLIWGAVTTVVVGVVMALMVTVVPPVGWFGLVAVVVLFLAMVLVRFVVGNRRVRLRVLAVLDVAIVVVGLVVVLVALANQAT